MKEDDSRMYAILADGITSACFGNEASGSAGDTMGAGNRSVETLLMGSAIVSCGVDDGIGIGAARLPVPTAQCASTPYSRRLPSMNSQLSVLALGGA